jgi:hypothetical protein
MGIKTRLHRVAKQDAQLLENFEESQYFQGEPAFLAVDRCPHPTQKATP